MGGVPAQGLFRAVRPRRPGPELDLGAGRAAPLPSREAHDFYPTVQWEPVRALIGADGAILRECGAVWEPAVGAGDMAREIEGAGLPVVAGDIVDRGWPQTEIRSFYDHDAARAPAIVTNPPYSEINARDGHGRWLRHMLALPGWRYAALLLSWDWPAARANGLGEMLDAHPFSWCYLMRWKIDFTGKGSPPQRNAWFVWDRCDVRGPGRGEPAFRWLDRPKASAAQGDMFAPPGGPA